MDAVQTPLRVLLIGLGAAVSAYGGWLLLTRQDGGQILDALIWLASGVVLHDAVLSGLVVLGGWVVSRRLPEPARAPVAIGVIVFGSLTLWAVPVLGRFGARADNPTLLDRPYLTAWLVSAVLVVAVGAGVTLARAVAPPRWSGSE